MGKIEIMISIIAVKIPVFKFPLHVMWSAMHAFLEILGLPSLINIS